jgi:alpha-methylacyl-CoA racemase
VTLAVNVPGPAAAARLHGLGASVTKVEPPGGDPLALASPDWYRELVEGHEVVRLDLKDARDRSELGRRLAAADLLLTAQRPAALARLHLAWRDLREQFPRLSHVAIVGHPEPDQGRAGHDLTYVASYGLLAPPGMPRTVAADLLGAERAVTASLGALLARGGGAEPTYAEVALSDAAAALGEPLRRGLTAPSGLLGGGFAGYGLYETADGWIAVAALEPGFQARLADGLGLAGLARPALEGVFRSRAAAEWEAWARERDLPLVAVRSRAMVGATRDGSEGGVMAMVQLTQLAEGSDEEIAERIRASGPQEVLDSVFRGMTERFKPQAASGVDARVQWIVTDDEGDEHPYELTVANGTCAAERTRAESPRVTLSTDVASFVKLMAGKTPGPQLYMTGKLKIQGDLMLAQRMTTFFEPPR